MAKILFEVEFVNLRSLTVENAAITCNWGKGGRAQDVGAQVCWIEIRPISCAG